MLEVPVQFSASPVAGPGSLVKEILEIRMNEPLKILLGLCIAVMVVGILWGALANPVKIFLNRTLFRSERHR